ncbi:MAG: cytochrome C oxidase subunit IV family protein [Gammaproteobacteria bacterium]|nr:cytochrome C oxidase subunit IV family protein [Gammaproteobacteria bacterium]
MEKSYRTNNIVFTTLVLLTLFTWILGQTDIIGDISEKIDGKEFFLILLSIAIIKVHLIGDFFMHLNTVSGFWRWIITLWAMLTGGFIAIPFLF